MNDYSGIIALAVVFAPILAAVIWYVGTNNRLVSLDNMIRESWSNVGTELRRRYDLIPNLVATVKGYAAHEKAVFDSVTQARERAMAAMASAPGQADEENQLVRTLRSLLAITEAYPQLKADTNFLQLQQELVNTEDRIQAARRFYNGNIRDYNNLVQCFPSSIVAGGAGRTARPYYEVEDLQALETPSANFAGLQPQA